MPAEDSILGTICSMYEHDNSNIQNNQNIQNNNNHNSNANNSQIQSNISSSNNQNDRSRINSLDIQNIHNGQDNQNNLNGKKDSPPSSSSSSSSSTCGPSVVASNNIGNDDITGYRPSNSGTQSAETNAHSTTQHHDSKNNGLITSSKDNTHDTNKTNSKNSPKTVSTHGSFANFLLGVPVACRDSLVSVKVSGWETCSEGFQKPYTKFTINYSCRGDEWIYLDDRRRMRSMSGGDSGVVRSAGSSGERAVGVGDSRLDAQNDLNGTTNDPRNTTTAATAATAAAATAAAAAAMATVAAAVDPCAHLPSSGDENGVSAPQGSVPLIVPDPASNPASNPSSVPPPVPSLASSSGFALVAPAPSPLPVAAPPVSAPPVAVSVAAVAPKKSGKKGSKKAITAKKGTPSLSASGVSAVGAVGAVAAVDSVAAADVGVDMVGVLKPVDVTAPAATPSSSSSSSSSFLPPAPPLSIPSSLPRSLRPSLPSPYPPYTSLPPSLSFSLSPSTSATSTPECSPECSTEYSSEHSPKNIIEPEHYPLNQDNSNYDCEGDDRGDNGHRGPTGCKDNNLSNNTNGKIMNGTLYEGVHMNGTNVDESDRIDSKRGRYKEKIDRERERERDREEMERMERMEIPELGLESQRRYSDFEILVSVLQRHYRGVILPPLPPKTWISQLQQQTQPHQLFAIQRQYELQLFLNSLLAHRTLRHSYELKIFLTPSKVGLNSFRLTFPLFSFDSHGRVVPIGRNKSIVKSSSEFLSGTYLIFLGKHVSIMMAYSHS